MSEPDFPAWDGQESVADYAMRAGLPPTKTLDLGSSVKMELTLIPAGSFIMGSPEHEKPVVGQIMAGISGGLVFVVVLVLLLNAWKKRRRPQFSLTFTMVMTFVAACGVWGYVRWNDALKHTDDRVNEFPAHVVRLTKAFYMGRFDVTQEQYQQIMGANPSSFIGTDNPVENVSWADAHDFCKKLSEKSGETVRLPSESEWEFACRAGSAAKYCSGDSEEDLERVGWHDSPITNSTHPVGQKEANRFGLYDVHGNVWQWCQDWYGDYSATPGIDPVGPAQGTDRVVRGGTWHYKPGDCRSAIRECYDPDYCYNGLGFRVVVSVSIRRSDRDN
ncbi:MAG: formylglycine-generating enzyme family protein [Planctomycetes bacterium]|nr:formylglycine-generating enzyme family protein [Planctomycetota bacterium]